MKIYKYLSVLYIPMLALSMFVFTGCDSDGSGNGVDGAPEVYYVRIPDPASADSLLVGASLGTNIVIIGNNLGDTRDIWFNDQQGVINPSWVTNTTIHVNVPSAAPAEVTNRFYLINGAQDTAAFDFVVQIAAPRLDNAKNEWPTAGEDLVINGDFFFEPATVTFTGGVVGEVVSVEQSQIIVSVPDGALEGPVTVETNFGEGVSSFHVWDSRNVFLDFTNSVGNGWRQGLVENADGPVDAEYLVVRGNIAANQRNEGDGPSPLLMQHWGIRGTRPEGNFYPGYYADYVLKFEAKVNSWYGGTLNICLAPWNHQDSNQEIWSNGINARAIWAPWAADNANYSTNGWVTVVIPMTEFRYSMGTDGEDNVVYEDLAFNEANAGSIATWILGSPENDGSLVEFYIDNMRIVTP